jgi:peptidoglycan pentaglycine glycine transferase (the first glycine)
MDLQLVRVNDTREWNDLLTHGICGHLLQSWEWGQFKEHYGWKAERLCWVDPGGVAKAAAQVLSRSVASHFSILYCPRGPALDWSDEELRPTILSELKAHAYSHKAIFAKIDPEIPIGFDRLESPVERKHPMGEALLQDLKHLGWRSSREQIQFRNTMLLNLQPPEEELLAGMKQKTRYNIRLAAKRGVRVRKGTQADLDLLYQMYAETSLRDHFTIRDPGYYQHAWGSFLAEGRAQPFIAEVEGEPIAGIIVFHFGDRATYMYGMSRLAHREKMPNHLLQWEAIRWAKAKGCSTYDFWGAPDRFDPADPMWGVFRFKEGFGSEIVHTIGAWDYPARPLLYQLYSLVLPGILAAMRKVGRKKTKRSLD